MSDAHPSPCGTWPSPLSPERASAAGLTLAWPGVVDGRLHWVEGRPHERGRSVLVGLDADGVPRDRVDAEADVRSRVHEYGGRPWCAVGGTLVHAQHSVQRLRFTGADGWLVTLTPPGCRYADLMPLPATLPGLAHGARRLLAVREDHRDAGATPSNAVVLLDLARPGEDRVLHEASDFVASPCISADGGRVACVRWNHPDMPWDGTELCMADLTASGTLAWRVVAGGRGESVLEPQWGPDGALYFRSDRSGWWNLHRWRADTGVEALTRLRVDLGDAPWQLGQSSYALVDRNRVLLCLNEAGAHALQVLDLTSGQLQALTLPYASFSHIGHLDGDRAFAVGAPLDGPPELLTFNLCDGRHEVIRRSGEAPLPPIAVSRPRSVAVATQPGPDGQPRQAQAWYYPPTSADRCVPDGERPPLMVLLHGGPTACSGPAFRAGVQFWTSRGFAVVDVNYGGSSGFGRAWRERLAGQWGVVDLADAVAAVEQVVADEGADPARVVIRGGSAGGFTVLRALAFTDRFAAGINYYGVSDLETLARDTHKFESHYLDRLVAPLPQGLPLYRERSPVGHMAGGRGALLTLQGSDDRVVPPQQSRAIVDEARAAGRMVAYVEFEGEAHGLRRAENQVRALQLELAFLGRVFGFRPADEVPPIELG